MRPFSTKGAFGKYGFDRHRFSYMKIPPNFKMTNLGRSSKICYPSTDISRQWIFCKFHHLREFSFLFQADTYFIPLNSNITAVDNKLFINPVIRHVLIPVKSHRQQAIQVVCQYGHYHIKIYLDGVIFRDNYICETTFCKGIWIFNTNAKNSKKSTNMMFLIIDVIGIVIASTHENVDNHIMYALMYRWECSLCKVLTLV